MDLLRTWFRKRLVCREDLGFGVLPSPPRFLPRMISKVWCWDSPSEFQALAGKQTDARYGNSLVQLADATNHWHYVTVVILQIPFVRRSAHDLSCQPLCTSYCSICCDIFESSCAQANYFRSFEGLQGYLLHNCFGGRRGYQLSYFHGFCF